jgi:hypothetical protein
MAKYLGRMKWTNTGADFIAATPRVLAALRQITDPPPPAKKAGPTAAGGMTAGQTGITGSP